MGRVGYMPMPTTAIAATPVVTLDVGLIDTIALRTEGYEALFHAIVDKLPVKLRLTMGGGHPAEFAGPDVLEAARDVVNMYTPGLSDCVHGCDEHKQDPQLDRLVKRLGELVGA